MGNELKIKFYGQAGQGIKTLAKILGKYLINENYNFITINVNYDSAVRGGNIDTDIILSKEKIDSPIIEKADLVLLLNKAQEIIPSEKIIYDSKIDCNLNNAISVNSESAIEKFGKRSLNMFYLGILLKYLQLKPNEEIFSLIPSNEENKKAFLTGYDSID